MKAERATVKAPGGDGAAESVVAELVAVARRNVKSGGENWRKVGVALPGEGGTLATDAGGANCLPWQEIELASNPWRLLAKERRAWDSNPQPLAGHLISSQRSRFHNLLIANTLREQQRLACTPAYFFRHTEIKLFCAWQFYART